MNIKVLCPCGAKFRFEIEPVNGRMPGPVKCPTCGGDATELANAVIAQQLSTPAPVATIMAPIPPQPIAAAPTATATAAVRPVMPVPTATATRVSVAAPV